MGYLTVTVAQYSLELNNSAILRHSIQSKLIRILDECQDLSGNWEEMIYLQFSGSEELNTRKLVQLISINAAETELIWQAAYPARTSDLNGLLHYIS